MTDRLKKSVLRGAFLLPVIRQTIHDSNTSIIVYTEKYVIFLKRNLQNLSGLIIMLNNLNQAAISGNSIKALFNGLKLAENPKLLEEIKQRFNLTYGELPTFYPFDRYLEMTDWLRRQLYPGQPEAVGFELLGRAITRGFFEGPVGQVLKLSIKVMGAQRSIPYFFRIAGGALRFGKFEVVENKPYCIRAILYNVPGSPEIMRGMSLESMEVANIQNATFDYTKLNSDDTEFIVRWKE